MRRKYIPIGTIVCKQKHLGPDHVEVMADPPTPIFFFYNAFSAVFLIEYTGDV